MAEMGKLIPISFVLLRGQHTRWCSCHHNLHSAWLFIALVVMVRELATSRAAKQPELSSMSLIGGARKYVKEAQFQNCFGTGATP